MANEILYYGGMIAAVIFGILAVLLFFILHIYFVIGDLTGITAKRRIRKLRNEGNIDKKNKISSIRNNTSKILVRHNKAISKSNKIQDSEKETLKLLRSKGKAQKKEDETTVLKCNENETVVLDSNKRVYFEIEKDIVITHSDETIK